MHPIRVVEPRNQEELRLQARRDLQRVTLLENLGSVPLSELTQEQREAIDQPTLRHHGPVDRVPLPYPVYGELGGT